MGHSEYKMPDKWTNEMDFFICDADARDLDPKVMMVTLKKLFPELQACAISLEKVQNRIRILDARPWVKYFKPGAVTRYRQFVEDGRLEDNYPGDVDYLNGEEILKDSELSVFHGGDEGEFSGYTGKGKGKHVRTLSGAFLDPVPSGNETRADHQARPRGSDDNSKTQATSLLDQLRERSDSKPPKPPKSPPIKLSPAKEAAKAHAATLKERMQAKHRRGSSSASESQGMSGRAGNVNAGQGASSSIRAVGVEDVFGGLALNNKSPPGRAR